MDAADLMEQFIEDLNIGGTVKYESVFDDKVSISFKYGIDKFLLTLQPYPYDR